MNETLSLGFVVIALGIAVGAPIAILHLLTRLSEKYPKVDVFLISAKSLALVTFAFLCIMGWVEVMSHGGILK